MDRDTEHPRRGPTDAATGARVGGISGALAGGGLLVLTGWAWWIPVGVAAGAAAGWAWERREAMQRQADRQD